jgi:hypothetical protein
VSETNTAFESSFSLKTVQKKYTAGENIVLQFESTQNKQAVLLVKNTFGSSILEPLVRNRTLSFKLPSIYSNKAGICNWQLVSDQMVFLSDWLNIAPSTKTTIIESYLGPKDILAGNTDYSMLVVIPTDHFDNPMADGLQVQEKHQFENTMSSQSLTTKNLLAWTNINSTKKTGRILVTGSCGNASSKEMTSLVLPNTATNFNITHHRNHEYADGNQIVTFTSSIIKDEFGNLVSDGTMVYFNIKESTGIKLQARGTTINGVAKARLLHPEHEEEWTVEAYVLGSAKSNALSIHFKAAILDFEIGFSADNRNITIGSLKSFMNQLAPDGISIQLKIYNATNKLLETKIETSLKGKTEFQLQPDFFPNGDYKVQISSARITKTKKITLK